MADARLDPRFDRRELLGVAVEAAREAAALVQKAWRTRFVVEHKGRVDLVTQFDRDSETLLRDRLGTATPFPVVGEEQGGEPDAGARGATWYVDPIDGTTNFVHGHPFWCVSVGLVAGNDPVLGVVVMAFMRPGNTAESKDRQQTRDDGLLHDDSSND